MMTATYIERRGEIETYFDRTAVEAWAKLTSDAPVTGVRATVRAGRDAMRATLIDWLPGDLSGRRVLDAGCGAGQFAIEAARRGADVVAVDLATNLLALARDRYRSERHAGSIEFIAGDMFDEALGKFDHVVAMDSLIHYEPADIVRLVSGFAARARRSVAFTFAPQTPLLAAMHFAGRFFPRGDRAPGIRPVSERRLRAMLGAAPLQDGWRAGRSQRINSGFYISNALELAHA